jgi:hypothetical protein
VISNTRQAAELYVDSWKRLDFDKFFDELDSNCQYSSQYVFDELDSKEKIVSYLTGKVNTIKNNGHSVLSKIAILKRVASLNPPIGTCCVAMYQGGSPDIAAIVFFEIGDGKIQRIDLCMPQLYQVTIEESYP